MEEHYRVPPISFSKLPLATAPSQAESATSELPDTHELPDSVNPRDNPDLDSLLRRSTTSESTRDDVRPLDIQYLDLIFKFQLLVKKTGDWAALGPQSKESDAFSSLQSALVDLRVWAYDLSDGADSFLESLRTLASRNSDLNAKLQQILGEISHLLAWIDDEADNNEGLRSRVQKPEQLLKQCQRIRGFVEILKTFKPSLAKVISAWKNEQHTLPTAPDLTSQPRSVLCFDGGGVKSYASLLILKTLMQFISEELAKQRGISPRTTAPRPCDVFDFIFGSSSGGLIAIMLGRLEMTIEECIERFCAYADTIFNHPRLRARLLSPFWASKYDADKITQATRRLVGDLDPTPSHDKWKRNVFGAPHGRCKTGVLATSTSHHVASYMFRTYDFKLPSTSESLKWMPLNPGPASTSQIWEVARATSAAPTFFPPIHFDDNEFVDGGLTANNPTQAALQEVAFLNGDKLAGTCIVSIGSGVSCDQPAAQLRSKDTGVHSMKDTFRILRAAATRTELTDTDVHFQASQDLGFVYFRLNPTHDRDIPLDEWDKSRRTQTEIEHSTVRYLETEEAKIELHRCASAIVSKMAGNVPSYAGNVHYFVPRTLNSLFTGRTELLHEIKQCLRSRKTDQVGLHKIFVITGMGGQGKSEICLKLTHDMREEFVINIPLNVVSIFSSDIVYRFWGIFWVDVSTRSTAESDFIALANRLGPTVENLDNAVQVLANTKKRWLLILDNADDPFLDYQIFLPSAKHGTIVITSRMHSCRQYNTIGAVTLESLRHEDLIELLLKASGISQNSRSSYVPQADEVINVLGSHTLAVIQAGAFISAGHCELDQYVKLFERHRQRMLRYTSEQARSRYGDIYSTFDVAAATLSNKSQCETDASCLLEVLSMLHCSHVPFQVFEDAWKASRRLQEFQVEIFTSRSTFLSERHISQLPAFVVAGQSGLNEWDPYRLNEAIYLLESLALVTRNRFGLSMHPLVHAWAKDRQADEQQAQSWLTTGSIIAVSNCESSLWQLHQRQLRPHIHSFLAIETAAAFSRGPREMILGILLQCGRILLQMRDNSRLIDLLDSISRELMIDPTDPDPALLPIYDLAAKNLLDLGRTEDALKLLERIVKIQETTLGPDHPHRLSSQHELAIAYKANGQDKDAVELEVQTMRTMKMVLGQEHPNTLSSMANLASIYNHQGRSKEAEELIMEVIEREKRVLGQEHPNTLSSMANLASIYNHQGRSKETEELIMEVIEKEKRVLGQEHPNTLSSMANLASIYNNQGRLKKAEELIMEVLEREKRMLSQRHPNTLNSMANLVSIFNNQEQWKETKELIVKVIEMNTEILDQKHPNTLSSMADLVSI